MVVGSQNLDRSSAGEVAPVTAAFFYSAGPLQAVHLTGEIRACKSNLALKLLLSLELLALAVRLERQQSHIESQGGLDPGRRRLVDDDLLRYRVARKREEASLPPDSVS